MRLAVKVMEIFDKRFASVESAACIVFTGSPGSADPLLEAIIQEKLKGISREASDRNDKYRKCKQLLMVGNVIFTPFCRSCDPQVNFFPPTAL